MHPSVVGLLQHLQAEFASALHDRAQHLIVALASEEDLASVQFEERASNRPSIDGKVVRHTKNYECSMSVAFRSGRVTIDVLISGAL